MRLHPLPFGRSLGVRTYIYMSTLFVSLLREFLLVALPAELDGVIHVLCKHVRECEVHTAGSHVVQTPSSVCVLRHCLMPLQHGLFEAEPAGTSTYTDKWKIPSARRLCLL